MSGGGTLSYVWGEGDTHPMSGGGGTPSQVWGGTPSQQVWGVPHPRSRSGRGTPSHVWGVSTHIQTWDGVPPIQTWDGVPPSQTWDGVPPPAGPGMGYPPGQTWDGVPPRPEILRWGTPPASVGRYTDWCQNITFPRTTYAGGKKANSPPNVLDFWTYIVGILIQLQPLKDKPFMGGMHGLAKVKCIIPGSFVIHTWSNYPFS